MGFNVTFWIFAKDDKSTLQPLDSQAVARFPDVEIFDNSTVVNPSLKIIAPITTNLVLWNYCRIAPFNRYYYVKDWEWCKGWWTAYLEVDPLASFKSEIGDLSCYVLRSYKDAQGNNIFDGNILDMAYPCTAGQPTYTAVSVTNPLSLSYNDGTYIVGVVNGEAANGSVTYYAFSRIGFTYFCQKLYDYNSGWLDIDVSEISENLQKALVNPFQYVVSCIYVPVPVTWFTNNNIGSATTTIYFGWWSIAVGQGARIIPTDTYYSLTTSLTIPKHPSASGRGAYLNLSPYTSYTLRYYPYGTIDLDTEALAGRSTLTCYMSLDICTGKGILNISVDGINKPIRTIETNVGVPMPTAAVQVDYMNLGTKSTAVMAGASAAAELTSGSGTWFENLVDNAKSFVENVRENGFFNSVGNVAKNVVSSITSAALASKATVEITGQQGTFSLFATQDLSLCGRFLPILNEDYRHKGRPLCQIKTINNLSGFILCSDVEIEIACTEREKHSIKAYMESGFYYE